MTIEEINALTVSDVESVLKERILIDQGETPPFDFEEWVFDPADLEAELAEYIAEEVAKEEARLVEVARVQDLKDRIDALHDANSAHAWLRCEVPNAALFRKQRILDNPDHAEAEALMVELEIKDAELKVARDAVQYQEDRRREYPSIEECIHAILDGTLEEVQAKRAAVKLKYPKP
jgi:hypothetical protein